MDNSGKLFVIQFFAVIGLGSLPYFIWKVAGVISGHFDWKEKIERKIEELDKKIDSVESSCADRHYSSTH